MDTKDIRLTKEEKRSMFSFHFKPRQREEEIKCFEVLYHEYSFLKPNLSDILDEYYSRIPDGSYSVSTEYERYLIYRREDLMHSLPNWLAILISLISLAVSIITMLFELRLLLPPQL